MKWTTPLLIGMVALLSTGCLRTLHTITAEQWDTTGKAQYYMGYWEGKCMGTGWCFNTRGKVMMCRLRDDNSLDCAEQQSLTEALQAKE